MSDEKKPISLPKRRVFRGASELHSVLFVRLSSDGPWLFHSISKSAAKISRTASKLRKEHFMQKSFQSKIVQIEL